LGTSTRNWRHRLPGNKWAAKRHESAAHALEELHHPRGEAGLTVALNVTACPCNGFAEHLRSVIGELNIPSAAGSRNRSPCSREPATTPRQPSMRPVVRTCATQRIRCTQFDCATYSALHCCEGPGPLVM